MLYSNEVKFIVILAVAFSNFVFLINTFNAIL